MGQLAAAAELPEVQVRLRCPAPPFGPPVREGSRRAEVGHAAGAGQLIEAEARASAAGMPPATRSAIAFVRMPCGLPALMPASTPEGETAPELALLCHSCRDELELIGSKYSAGRVRPPGQPSQSRSVIAATEPTSGRRRPLAGGLLHAYCLGCLRDPQSRPADPGSRVIGKVGAFRHHLLMIAASKTPSRARTTVQTAGQVFHALRDAEASGHAQQADHDVAGGGQELGRGPGADLERSSSNVLSRTSTRGFQLASGRGCRSAGRPGWPAIRSGW